MSGKISTIATLFWMLLKKGLPLVAGLAVLVLVIAWMSGAYEKKVPPGESDVVFRTLDDQPTAEVQEVSKEVIEEALGTLKSAQRTVISAKVLARIKEMTVTAGDSVEAGQILIKLEDDALKARLNQAQELLKSAKASHEEARKDFERAEKLFKAGVTTQSQFDAAQARVRIAEAEENRADQALSEATIMLSYTTIAAPKTGRIVDRLAEPGDTASPGQPLLTLYDPSSLRLEVPVMEALALKLKVGDQIRVRIDALDREVNGVIQQRVPQAEAASRSFLIKVLLPKSEEFYEGMFGRLLIPAGARRHLCLPDAAVRKIGQLEFVDVVRPDQTLERRMIKTGRRGMGGKVEVLSGVEADEVVVTTKEDAS